MLDNLVWSTTDGDSWICSRPVDEETHQAWIYADGPGRDTSAGIDLYKEAMKAGAEAVAGQRAQLDSIRTKVISLLSFVGSATGFMVGATLTRLRSADAARAGFLCWAVVATAVSVAAIVAAVLVLASAQWGKSETDGKWIRITRWQFEIDLAYMMANIDDTTRPATKVQRSFIERYRAMIQKNAPGLTQVQRTYATFVGLICLQLVAWTTVIWIYG